MLRKATIYLLLFAIISFSSDSYLKYSIAQQNEHQSPYRLAFASVGANLLESRVDCWATIKSGSSDNELAQILGQLLQHLNLPVETNRFLYQESKGIRTLEYNLFHINRQYYFLVQPSQEQNNAKILVTVIAAEEEGLPELESQLRELYDFTTYYQYHGIIDAHTSLDGREELLSIVLTNLEATVKSRYQDNSMSSCTGYSRSIPISPVKIEGGLVNLQAVVRDQTGGKTEVYLGAPFLLCDY